MKKILSENGVEVWLPIADPYPSQLQMVQKLTKAFVCGQNAMIETPTGNGKTIALLSCALAYEHQQR